MARKRSQDTEERTTSKRRYSTTRDSDGSTGSVDSETRGTARPHEEGMTSGFYEGEDLNEASIEDLREFADELQIEDYESMSRNELVREIRNQTQARP